MELSQGKHKASKLGGEEDFISSMPENVVMNILDRLPLQDAVRTSTLSKNWMFKWTMLSQLVFDVDFFEYLLDNGSNNDYKIIISSFVNVEDISHWILFLSRKGIKDLTLRNASKLPTHLFSCLELKHLKLEYRCFDSPTTFHGSANLLSLELRLVSFGSGEFEEFFTRCPALETLNIRAPYYNCKVKLAEIAKLANLKVLSLFLCNLDNTGSSSMLELVGSLPKLQELNLDFSNCKVRFTQDGAKKRLPATFSCLKTLKLSEIDLSDGFMLSYAFDMIWSSPNLQTLKIIGSVSDEDDEPTPTVCSPEVDCYAIMLLQLRSVVFTDCKASDNEVRLIRYLLACSPVLKKIAIHLVSSLKLKERFMFSMKLLRLPRASLDIDIGIDEL